MTLVVLLALLIYADQRGWLLVPAGDDFTTFDQHQFLVTRVIDGDTIEIAAVDARRSDFVTRVRLWGIDCPEIAHFGKPAEPWADDAADFTRDRCEGELVMLLLDTNRRRDAYDRLLAHVIVPEEAMNMNEALLRAGLAHADERWPHAMLETYRAAAEEGKEKRAGLWSDGPRPRN